MPGRGVAPALAVLLATGSLAACGGPDGGSSSACAPVERPRAQFPAGHVLPGQPEPRYESDPPTSGPHVAVLQVPTGTTGPLPRPLQVGLLELGLVLVQYRPADLGPDQVAAVQELARPDLVIAPNPELPDPVVATAWLHVLRCQAVDGDSLAAFAEEHIGRAPGGHLED